MSAAPFGSTSATGISGVRVLTRPGAEDPLESEATRRTIPTTRTARRQGTAGGDCQWTAGAPCRPIGRPPVDMPAQSLQRAAARGRALKCSTARSSPGWDVKIAMSVAFLRTVRSFASRLARVEICHDGPIQRTVSRRPPRGPTARSRPLRSNRERSERSTCRSWALRPGECCGESACGRSGHRPTGCAACRDSRKNWSTSSVTSAASRVPDIVHAVHDAAELQPVVEPAGHQVDRFQQLAQSVQGQEVRLQRQKHLVHARPGR